MKVKTNHNSLLDPAVLESVQGLQLISRVLSEELLAGANVSKKTGVGMEFSQYRTYEPGDDLRLLDWKLYGRTERYYVRQSVVYSNIHIRFVMDNTASMGYEEQGISKYTLGSVLIAVLANLAYNAGDQFSLSFINGKTLPMAATRRHLDRLLFNLHEEKPHQAWPAKIDVNSWTRSLKKEYIIIITDLYQEQNELFDFIDKIKLPGNEVVIFNVEGKQESDMSFKNPIFFKDLETGQMLKTDPVQIRGEYQQKRNAYFSDFKERLKQIEVPVYNFLLGESPSQKLRRFLTERTYLHL